MKRLFVTVLCLILSLGLSGCSSKAEEGVTPDNSQESTLGPNGASRGPNALGANGLPLLPDEAAEDVCFASFHYFLDSRDPAFYDENSNPLYPDAFVTQALGVQELWNEIKWMDEKFGTTFAKFALDMGKFAAGQTGMDSFESETWCKLRAFRVNDGSP
jgi:hypothetical protein